MDNNDNMYKLEQEGTLKVDRLLVGLCGAMFPAYFAIFAAGVRIPMTAKPWACSAIVTSVPAILCLMWHLIRFPLRLKAGEIAAVKANNKFVDDLEYVLENVAEPRMNKAVLGEEGENVFLSEDGVEYVNCSKEDALEKMKLAITSAFDSNSPIMQNVVYAHSHRMAKAQRQALYGKLPENMASAKQVLDLSARFLRHPLAFTMLVSATMFMIKLLF